MDDEELADRLRALRGLAPRRRVAPWRQLLNITLSNVNTMIMEPAEVVDEPEPGGSTVEPLTGIVEVSGFDYDLDARCRGQMRCFVHALGKDPEVREVARVVHARKGVSPEDQDVGWWVSGSKALGQRVSVHFHTSRYVSIARQVEADTRAKPNRGHWLSIWMRAFEDLDAEAGPPIIEQCIPPNERVIQMRAGWYISKVEAPANLRTQCEQHAPFRRPKMQTEFAESSDDSRATLWLKKVPDSWLMHDGRQATPWGVINSALDHPELIEGSRLAQMLQTVQADYTTWMEGLKMPPYDEARVRRILDAQTLLVEVPLAP